MKGSEKGGRDREERGRRKETVSERRGAKEELGRMRG